MAISISTSVTAIASCDFPLRALQAQKCLCCTEVARLVPPDMTHLCVYIYIYIYTHIYIYIYRQILKLRTRTQRRSGQIPRFGSKPSKVSDIALRLDTLRGSFLMSSCQAWTTRCFCSCSYDAFGFGVETSADILGPRVSSPLL